MSPKTESRKRPAATGKSPAGFTEDEIAAMKEHAREVKRQSRRSPGDAAAEEREVLAKIAEMPEPDRTMATRLHELVQKIAPDLVAKTWYGMPAYARDGKVVCFFQTGQKFKSRYATLGFSDSARLDEGHMWPTSFALTAWTDAEERRITALLQQAIG
jgi:hypothetical protein